MAEEALVRERVSARSAAARLRRGGSTVRERGVSQRDVERKELASMLLGAWALSFDELPDAPEAQRSTMKLRRGPTLRRQDSTQAPWWQCWSCFELEDEDKACRALMRTAVAPVTLNVYSVGRLETVRRLNGVTRQFGGLFHAGVEIHGQEWSFGFSHRGCGIVSCRPRRCPLHTYRESVYLGDCGLPPPAVLDILRAFRHAWPGDSYDLLHKNCCNFANDFVSALGVARGIPRWVDRLARIAATLDEKLRKKATAASSIEHLAATRIARLFRRTRRPAADALPRDEPRRLKRGISIADRAKLRDSSNTGNPGLSSTKLSGGG